MGESGLGVYLDFADAIQRLGEQVIRDRYDNLFHMYEKITGENPYETPMRIFPAVHYTMGGLWVDYDLMSNIPGLYVIGEANFSDHGANRLGASALMQGLADGYFILPYTIGDYLARVSLEKVGNDHPEVRNAEAAAREFIDKLLSVQGRRTVDSVHRELGRIMWEHCGMARNEAGLKKALDLIPALREEFWENVIVPGGAMSSTPISRAGRVADFLEFAEVMCHDALDRGESCGCHLREECQTPDGEAERNDAEYSYVAAWEHTGVENKPALHKEALEFEEVKLAVRSYK